MLMRHFGHGVGHLQYKRQHEMETEITRVDLERDNDDHDSNIVTRENAQENNLAVDIEDKSQGEADHGEMDVDGYNSKAEISEGSDNGGASSDDSDTGYRSF